MADIRPSLFKDRNFFKDLFEGTFIIILRACCFAVLIKQVVRDLGEFPDRCTQYNNMHTSRH